MATYGITPWATQAISNPANVNVLSGTSAVTTPSVTLTVIAIWRAA